MTQKATPGWALIGRLVWMVGPAALLVLILVIAGNGGGWLGGKSIAYLVILAGILAGRFLEFCGGDPRTADGQPATPAHLRRYVAAMVAVGLAAFALANLIGNRT